MLRYREALNIILSEAQSFGKEKIALDQAHERVLSEKIFADRDYPPFNRSTMDGFAMRFADVESGIRQFKSIETIFAGAENNHSIHAGECFKIMTGAAVPTQADIVIRKEDVHETRELISVQSDQFRRYQNIAKKGEDLREGKLIIDNNIVCSAPVISLLAAIGKTEVIVERLPTVSIITTGNEVISADGIASATQIRNSNAALLKALLQKHVGSSFSFIHVQDDPAKLRMAFEEAMGADIIISSGAVSAGEADFVPVVLQQLGVQKLFHKVAIKPGKPIWCGKKPGTGMVFALPGNPLSCLVTFTVFLRPFIRACLGLSIEQPYECILNGERKKKSELDEFFPVKMRGNENRIEAIPFNGSGDIRAALFADGIAQQVFDKSEIKGEAIPYFPFT